MDKVDLIFQYDASALAPITEEHTPSLLLWNSSLPGWAREIQIAWKDNQEGNGLSLVEKTSIAVDTKTPLKSDAVVGFQIFVLSKNYAGEPCRVKAGSAVVYWKDLKALENKEAEIELRLPTFRSVGKEPLLKGKLAVRVDDASLEKVRGMTFQDDHALHLTPDNLENMQTMMYVNIQQNMFPFTKTAAENGLEIQPTTKEAEQVHAPAWIHEAGVVPSLYYWIDHVHQPADEAYFANLAHIALSRKRMTAQRFLELVDAQWASSSKELLPGTLDAAEVFGTMLVAQATALPYIGDFTHEGHRGSMWSKMMDRKVDLESFDDGLRRRSDDCEGLAHVIVMNARRLARASHFQSPVLTAMRKFSELYVDSAWLGSVTARNLTDASARQRSKNGVLLQDVIDSPADGNIVPGAHIWAMFVPRPTFEAAIQRCAPDLFSKKKLPEVPAWTARLPVLLGEGTGRMRVLNRPIAEYATSSEEREEKIKGEIKYRNALATILKDAKDVQQIFAVEKGQDQIEDDGQDRRYTGFYREVTHAYTSFYYDHGLKSVEFTVIQTEPRSSHRASNDGKWRYGVPFRDLVDCKNHIGLAITPAPLPEQQQIAETFDSLIAPPLNPKAINASPVPDAVEKFQIKWKVPTPSYKNEATCVQLYLPLHHANGKTIGALDAVLSRDETRPLVVGVEVHSEAFMKHVEDLRFDVWVKENK